MTVDPEEDVGTVRWFGKSWEAPVNDPRTEVPVPVEAGCAYCGHAIIAHQRGVGVPDALTGNYLWWHLSCWLRVIAGEVTDEVFRDG